MRQKRPVRKSKKVFLKIFFFILSIGILPLTVSLLINIPDLFANYNRLTSEMLFTCGGFSLFIFLFFLFGPPVKSYILEHELSHLLFAFLSGIEVKKFSIKDSEGYVKTERINIIIALAPYSLPLYTLFIIIIYRILVVFYRSNILASIFYFIIGITISFHIIATIHYLQLDQPDLKRYGYFSSLVFILTWSLFILSLIFALLFERVELIRYLRISLFQCINFYRGVLALFFS